MRRRNKRWGARGSTELVVGPVGGGLALFGPQEQVDAYVDALTSAIPERPPRRAVIDLAHVAATVGSVTSMNGQYVELSQKTLEQLQEHARNVKVSEWSSGVIRDTDGSILSHIEWAPVDFGPQQLLMMQQVATMVALRAAIAEVAEAVARVEGKLDVLTDLIHAERIGNAIGDFKFLGALAARVEEGESISDTDWSSIAHLGAAITRDVESLRSFVRLRLEDERRRTSTWSRAERMDDLSKSHIDRVLGALMLSEHNLMTWQRLRVARHDASEPKQLASAVADASRMLEHQRDEDQRLVSDLERELDELIEASGLEGLIPHKRSQLLESSARLNGAVDWFAEQRNLDVTDNDVELPGFGESAKELTRRVNQSARTVAGEIGRRTPGRRTDRDGEANELSAPGDDGPAQKIERRK